MAFVWLGFGWGGLGLLTTLLFFRDRAERERAQSKSQATAAGASAVVLPGLTFGEALRSPAILRIALSTFITIFLGLAFLVHQVPILTEAGVSRSTAAYLASLTGLAGVAGKLLTGMMTDRWNAGVVGGVTLATPAIAFVMLLEPFRSPALIVAAMLIIGYSAGAKLQVTAYLTSRYAGMRHFGKIFGIMGSLMAIASGLGPVAAGALYDASGDYTALLVAGIPGRLLCGFLIMGLGPFPSWDAEAPVGGDEARSGSRGFRLPRRIAQSASSATTFGLRWRRSMGGPSIGSVPGQLRLPGRAAALAGAAGNPCARRQFVRIHQACAAASISHTSHFGGVAPRDQRSVHIGKRRSRQRRRKWVYAAPGGQPADA